MHEPVPVAQRFGDLGAELVLQVGDDDVRSRGDQGAGHAFAQALCAAGDQRAPAGEIDRCHGGPFSARFRETYITCLSLTVVKKTLDERQAVG
ncbi:hypothetical protein Abr02nite_61000 [Paractinoplanes brasiliensis]|nr:hypothetical protein Abr02nite_61000 [Actinoplanes brasiliensis]